MHSSLAASHPKLTVVLAIACCKSPLATYHCPECPFVRRHTVVFTTGATLAGFVGRAVSLTIELFGAQVYTVGL